MPAPGLDAEVVASLWPRDDVVQVNHGSFGGVPLPVLDAWYALLREEQANPHAWYRALVDRVTQATEELSAWLGGEARSAAMVANASAGLTLLLAQLAEGSRRVVLTDHGYGAVDRAARRTGLAQERVHLPLDATDEDVLERLGAVVRTGDLVVLDHSTSPTAKALPVREADALCRDRGARLVVDGAHAPGQLDRPLEGFAAAWVGNLHKWACAPRGTALLQAPDGDLLPATASWWEEQRLAERFGFQGTQQYAHWLAAPTAIRVISEQLGWPETRSACSQLADDGQRLVCERVGTAPPDVGTAAPMMRLVELPGGPSDEEACAALRLRIADEHHVEVAITTWGGRGFARLSAFAYNDLEDYARLADALSG